MSHIMDTIETNLRALLSGTSINDSLELCDFTLAAQNEATGKSFITILSRFSILKLWVL